jgi:hypothetical protein
VPGPEVSEYFRTFGLLKVSNAEAAKDVEAALRVLESVPLENLEMFERMGVSFPT